MVLRWQRHYYRMEQLLLLQLEGATNHTPRGTGAQGREAAIIDVAQDLLLRHLHDMGIGTFVWVLSEIIAYIRVL